MFLAVATERSHGHGITLIREGETSDRRVLLMVEGRAEVLRHARNGKVVSYGDVLPGDLVGVVAAMDGESRFASVVARSPGRTAWVDLPRFDALMAEPAFAREVQALLAAKVRALSERVFEFSTMLVRERLVRELVRRADAAAGGHASGTVVLQPAPVHSELAARIATHREAVSREISHLTRIGILQRQGRSLLIIDRNALAALLARSD